MNCLSGGPLGLASVFIGGGVTFTIFSSVPLAVFIRTEDHGRFGELASRTNDGDIAHPAALRTSLGNSGLLAFFHAARDY